MLPKLYMSRLHQDDGQPATGQKVCIATTSYDRCDDHYTFSLASSLEALHEAGIQTAYYLLNGNCHVDDARNRIIQEFLLSDCTDLVFIDADVSWQAKDLVKLCQYDLAVVGGVYPFRRADKQDDMPMRMMHGASVANGLLEVEGLPTGFLRFRRKVIERLVEECEEFDGNNGHETRQPILFQRVLKDGTRWGGDLHVCNMWRNMGGHIFCATEMQLGHAAKETYTDSMGAFLRRKEGSTLEYVADKIGGGNWAVEDLEEARRHDGGEASATEELLTVALRYAEKATHPIIETSSGLNTVLIAAATSQMVYCIENDAIKIQELIAMAKAAHVTNIAIVSGDIIDEELPGRFSLAVGDGFMLTGEFGECADVLICDDAINRTDQEFFTAWAERRGLQSLFIQPRTMVIHGNS